MSNLKVVVDTNVLISGLFGMENAPSYQILKAIRNQKIIFVTSPPIIEEISNVLSRPRIIKLTKMSDEEQKEFIQQLIERSDITKGAQLSQIVSRDSKDDKFLACAFEAKADYLVTGDEDLLVVRKYKGIKIVTPRELMQLMT